MVRGSVVSTTAADVCAVLCIVLSIMWTVCCIVPWGWHRSHLVHTLKLDCGLYSVTVSKDILGHFASLLPMPDWAKDLVNHLPASLSMQEMTDKICVVQSSTCSGWHMLHTGSILFCFMAVFVILSFWASAGFLFYFFHTEATETGRKFMRLFIILTPTVGMTAILLYFFLTMGFGDEDSGITYGASFFIVLFATMFAFAPMIIFESCVHKQAMVCVNARADIKAAREFDFHQGGGQGGSPPFLQPQVQMSNFPGGGGGGAYGHQGSMSQQQQPPGGYGHGSMSQPQGGGFPGGAYPSQQMPPPPGYQGGPQQGPQGYRY